MPAAMMAPMMASAAQAAAPGVAGAGSAGASAFLPQLMEILSKLGLSFGMRRGNTSFGMDFGRGRKQSELAELLKLLQQGGGGPVTPPVQPPAGLPVTTVGGPAAPPLMGGPTQVTPSFSALLRPTGMKRRMAGPGMLAMR
jgi:hypothetical protein